jgi:N-acetylneuraminate synthase
MIKMAKIFCKADVVKFQKRNNKLLLTESEYNAPHPNPQNSYGTTYGEHREFLEFSIDQHRELKKVCDELEIAYSSSVWDICSTKEIISLNPPLIKIPSALNTNFEILGYLCENYSGDIHISLGMTTREEQDKIVAFITERGRGNSTVLYACTSGYPVAFEDICLLEISRLLDLYGDKIREIGFSGHHLGIAVDVAASWVERHFTLDRTWKGTDHAASLEPDGLRRVVRDLHAVQKSLAFKNADLLEVEKVQRKKLKWDRNRV